MHKSIILIIWVLGVIRVDAITESEDDEKKVLLLNSYHKGYLWSDEIVRGVEETLEGKVDELFIEYLDTKRQFSQDYRASLSHMLELKHSIHDFDLIITSDDNAFSFLKDLRETTFKNIPVVFCGLNYLDPAQLEGLDNITGISEEANIEGNISLIKKLHPECHEILVITDNTITGKHVQDRINRIIIQNESNKPEIKLLFDISMDNLVDSLHRLSEGTIVLQTFFFSDNLNKFYEFNESIRIICENSDVPVYGSWDFTMGYGIVGGYLVQGEEQGKAAATIALEILSGIPADSIPVIYSPMTQLQFDYRELQSAGILEKELPDNATILFKPATVFQTYKKEIIIVLVFIIFLILFIVSLSIALRRSEVMTAIIKKNEVWLSSLIENIPGTVYRCRYNNEWVIDFLSDNILNLSGYPKSIFENKEIYSFNKLIHPDDYEEMRENIDQCLKEHKPWENTYRIRKEDGEIRWIYEAGKGVKDEKGDLLFLDGIFIDVTAEKEAEKELEEHKKNLEELVKHRTMEVEELNLELKEKNIELNTNNEMLLVQKSSLEDVIEELKQTQQQLIQSEKMASIGILTSGIAHEINNPLNFISSGLTGLGIILGDLLELSKESIEVKLPEKYQGVFPALKKVPELMQSIQNGVNRTTQIVKGLRTFSRLDSEHKTEANIHELLDSTLVILNNKLKHRIEVVKNYGVVPQINCFPGKLGQVFLNLILNSAQAISDQGTITISTKVNQHSKKLQINIWDSGCGIPENIKSRIFDPFFTTKTVGDGTGLGLSIVHGIIEEHSGSIELNSNEGEGAEFVIQLPLTN